MKRTAIITIAALLVIMGAMTSCTVATSDEASGADEIVTAEDGMEGALWSDGSDDVESVDEADSEVEGTEISDDDSDSASSTADADAELEILDGSDSYEVEVGDSFDEQFRASICDGNEYEWSVEGLPSWFDEPATVGSCNERLNLYADSIPFSAKGQVFTITVVATDASSTLSATRSFSIEVKMQHISANVPDVAEADASCGEPLSIEMIENSNGEGNDSELHQKIVPISSHRRVRFKISGGKPPYHVSWNSHVLDSQHCKDANKSYHDEGAYRFSGSCNDDEIKTVTRNYTWETSDIVECDKDPHDDLTCLTSGTMADDDDEFMLEGQFKYAGPLPISKFAKADGTDDLNELPVEALDIIVRDQCASQTVEIESQGGETKTVTTINIAADQLVFKLSYPTDDLTEDMSVKMKYGETNEINAGDKLKVFFSPDPMFNFSHKCATASAIFNLSDDGSSYADKWTSADAGALGYSQCDAADGYYDDSYEQIGNTDTVLLVWEGLCSYQEKVYDSMNDYHNETAYPVFDVKKIVFQSTHWEGVYNDTLNLNLYDEIVTDSVTCERGDMVTSSDGWQTKNSAGGKWRRREIVD